MAKKASSAKARPAAVEAPPLEAAGPVENSSSAPVADPAGVVADILESGPAPAAGGGRTSTERVREYRKRKAAEAAPAAPLEITDADVREAGALFSFVWDVAVVPFTTDTSPKALEAAPGKGLPRLRSLDESQVDRAGRVYAPLVKKWAPLLGAWMPEALALLCTLSLVKECRIVAAPVADPAA